MGLCLKRQSVSLEKVHRRATKLVRVQGHDLHGETTVFEVTLFEKGEE